MAVVKDVTHAPRPKKNKIKAGDAISEAKKATPIKNQIRYILIIDVLNIEKL